MTCSFVSHVPVQLNTAPALCPSEGFCCSPCLPCMICCPRSSIANHLPLFPLCALLPSVLQPSSSAGEAEAQAEAAGAVPQQLLYGCQVCRMLPDHDRVQPQPVGAAVQQLLYCAGNTHWRQVPLDRGSKLQVRAVEISSSVCTSGQQMS